MMEKTLPEFYVISGKTEKKDYTENLLNDILASKQVFQQVNGFYKEESETSFIIYQLTYPSALALMLKYEQECILKVDSERCAYLVYNNGSIVYVGK
jgi:hypothetical protein